jgi:hypothetical protein
MIGRMDSKNLENGYSRMIAFAEIVEAHEQTLPIDQSLL